MIVPDRLKDLHAAMVKLGNSSLAGSIDLKTSDPPDILNESNEEALPKLSNYCTVCRNLLRQVVNPNNTYYECVNCKLKYKDDNKGLLYSTTLKKSSRKMHRSETELRHAAAYTVLKTCTHCSHILAKGLRDETLKLILFCAKCGKQHK